MGRSWCQGGADSWGVLGCAQGMGRGGDTKRVVVVAGRQRRGWYREGGGSGTERVAVAVAQRRQWRWHGEVGSSGM